MSDPNNLWFTSDTHFGHDNIIKYSSRPFKTVEEMDEELIKNWNEVVPEDGIVWHLGDLSFHKKDRTVPIVWRLNGIIHFIKGNHDGKKLRPGVLARFASIQDYAELSVLDDPRQRIILSHFPFTSWNKMHYGSWNLHGHCHGTLKQKGKQYDVGVDPNNFRPVSYHQVKEILEKKKVVLVDYHGTHAEEGGREFAPFSFEGND